MTAVNWRGILKSTCMLLNKQQYLSGKHARVKWPCNDLLAKNKKKESNKALRDLTENIVYFQRRLILEDSPLLRHVTEAASKLTNEPLLVSFKGGNNFFCFYFLLIEFTCHYDISGKSFYVLQNIWSLQAKLLCCSVGFQHYASITNWYTLTLFAVDCWSLVSFSM